MSHHHLRIRVTVIFISKSDLAEWEVNGYNLHRITSPDVDMLSNSLDFAALYNFYLLSVTLSYSKVILALLHAECTPNLELRRK